MYVTCDVKGIKTKQFNSKMTALVSELKVMKP